MAKDIVIIRQKFQNIVSKTDQISNEGNNQQICNRKTDQ